MPEVPPTKNFEGRLSRASTFLNMDSRLRENDNHVYFDVGTVPWSGKINPLKYHIPSKLCHRSIAIPIRITAPSVILIAYHLTLPD